MNLNKLLIALCCFGLNLKGMAQIYPPMNSTIGHLQVMFKAKPVNAAEGYSFAIYQAGKLIDSLSSEYPASLSKNLLSYGKTYQCKTYFVKNGVWQKQLNYTFRTKKNIRANKQNYQISILNYSPHKCEDGLIIMDNNFVVNRQGDVAYCIDTSLTFVRDLTLTPQQTWLYLDSNQFIETNLNGKIIWKSKTIETDSFIITDYHHDIHKTKRSTYFCLASIKYKKISQQVKYNAVVELDKLGNLLWIWDERKYYPNDSNLFKASHMNSLFVDEKNNELIISNRDLHSIVSISYPSKLVNWSFGYEMGNDVPYIHNQITKMQHRVIKVNDNALLVFNNDSSTTGNTITKVQYITKPSESQSNVEVLWQYDFNFDSDVENHIPRMGGAVELKNKNILIACGIFDRNFEIDSLGEIVWELRMSQLNPSNKQLSAVPCYRNNFVTSLYPYEVIAYRHNNVLKVANVGSEPSKISWVEPNGKAKHQLLKPGENIKLSLAVKLLTNEENGLRIKLDLK